MINDENTPEFEQDENQNEADIEETEETNESEESTGSDSTDWKAEALKYKAILDRNKKKPEVKEAEPKPTQEGLSTLEVYALMEAKIPQQDISVVQKYAQLNEVSLTEALQDSTLKMILSNKAEERRVAEGTNTGSARRGTSKVSDDVLMSRIQKGEIPQDEDEIKRYNAMRWGMKK